MSDFSNIVPNFSVLFQIVGMHKEKGNWILVKIFAVGHTKNGDNKKNLIKSR